MPELVMTSGVCYGNALDGAFLSLVGRRGLVELQGDAWLTSATSLDVAGGKRRLGAAYKAENRTEALVEFEGAVVHLILQQASLVLRIAGATSERVAALRAQLRRELSEVDVDSRGEAQFAFWWATEHGPRQTVRTLPVPSFEEIELNYSGEAQERLRRLAQVTDPSRNGKLVLWHGEPGTGKTYALRALAWEWRRWCDFHYVTDPDALFGADGTGYLMGMVTRRADDRHGVSGAERWRCLVLEDTGELMAVDANRRTGQALSPC